MKKSLYIYNCGDLKRKDNTLRFTTYDDEKRDVPIERISDIYVMSELSFNTKFINFISQYGIPMHFFNYYHFWMNIDSLKSTYVMIFVYLLTYLVIYTYSIPNLIITLSPH